MNLLLEIWRRAAIEWITILFVQQSDTFKITLRSISKKKKKKENYVLPLVSISGANIGNQIPLPRSAYGFV